MGRRTASAQSPTKPGRLAGSPGPAAEPSGGSDASIASRNRSRILRAATVQFADKGFRGTTIGSIASEADLPRANVYYYFSSKEEIYRAILGDLIAGWDAALGHISPDQEPEAALEAYVRAKLDHARRNTDESRLFALEILGGAPFLGKVDRKHMQEATRAASLVIEGWVAAGKMKPVDPRHLFILLWSVTQFYTDFEILAADALDTTRLVGADFDEAARTVIRIVLRGVAADNPGAEA